MTTLYDRPWWMAYSGPEAFPPGCTDCTKTSGAPFRVALPGVDVHLDPASPLVGSGDAAPCVGNPLATCTDPGYFGGPVPPRG